MLYSPSEISVAEWITTNTPEKSIFLTSDRHNHPALLAGREVVMGYTGWLWTHGFDYLLVGNDVIKMYQNADFDLMRKYNVSYIYVGPDEQKEYVISEKIKELPMVMQEPVKIYSVNKQA